MARFVRRAWPAFAAAVVAVCRGVSALTLISLNVFHLPHAGHFPIHLGDSCPQFSHTYATLSFAILFVFMLQKYKNNLK
jgi:hypothetical protein